MIPCAKLGQFMGGCERSRAMSFAETILSSHDYSNA